MIIRDVEALEGRASLQAMIGNRSRIPEQEVFSARHQYLPLCLVFLGNRDYAAIGAHITARTKIPEWRGVGPMQVFDVFVFTSPDKGVTLFEFLENNITSSMRVNQISFVTEQISEVGRPSLKRRDEPRILRFGDLVR